MSRWLQLVVFLLVISSWVLAFSNLPPTRQTGAFGESNCTTCHTGASVNSGPGSFRIEGVPLQYSPGATVPITITISHTGQRRWGFELAARVRTSGAQAGSFSSLSAETAVRASNNVQYIAQTLSGVRDGVTNGPVSWTVNWTAPASAAGEVLFTAAGLAADGDGTERGDFTYTAQVSSSAPGQVISPLPAKPVPVVLPQMATGGGYVSRIFLSNLTPAANQVQIQIIGQDGRVAASVAVTLPAGGSYLYSTGEESRFAPNTLVQWAAIGADAPVATSLLYDLRNPTTRELQAAVAVLDSPPCTVCTAPFLFRSDGVTLGLALANLTEAENAITLKLLDRDGNIVVNDSLTLAPYEQTAFVVSDRPRFSEYLRGRAEFFGSLSLTGTQRFAPVAIGAEGSELFAVPLVSGAAR